MIFQSGPYILPLFFVGAMAIVLAVYAWRQRPALGATAFAISLIGEAIWSLSNAMQWASPDFAAQVFWLKMRFLGTEAITFFFLIFALQYTRQERRLPGGIYLLGLVPLAVIIMVWTNDAHNLFFTALAQVDLGGFTAIDLTYGPLFWFHTAADYALLTITFVIYAVAFFSSRSIYRGQMGAVLLGLSIPWVANMITIFEINPIPYLDLTPFGILLGMVALTAGFFRYRILDLVSISRDMLLRHISDALLVIDREQRIADLNPAAAHLFYRPEYELLGQPIDTVFPEWSLFSQNLKHSGKEIIKEIQLEQPTGVTFYRVKVTPILREDGDNIGRLIQLQDISDRKQTEAERRKSLSFLEALEEAYFETDVDGKLTYVNAVFANTVGRQPGNVLGENFDQFLPEVYRSRITRLFRNVLETGVTATGVDYPFQNQSGGLVHGEASISRLLDEAERPLGLRVLIRDVTERVEAARRINQAKDEAEARARDLASINRMADRVSSSLQLTEILKTICVELVDIFQSRNAGIGLLDNEKQNLVIAAFHAADAAETDATGIHIPLDGNEASRHALESRNAVVIADAQTDPRTKSAHALMVDRGTRSLMIVPLMARGEAIGTIGLPSRDPDRRFTGEEVSLAETIARQVASAIDNARLYELTERARDVAERDLEIGRSIQTSFFPNILPRVDGWELMTFFQAARQVAGDFYDAFYVGTQGRVAVVLADVTDKGVGAALFMALFRSLIRSSSESEDFDGDIQAALIAVVQKVNNYIADTHGDSNMFATMIFGVLDPGANTFCYINAGHEMPLIVNADGELVARLEPTGPAVGLMVDLAFSAASVRIAPGDLFFSFTDGVSDARNIHGKFFGEKNIEDLALKPHDSAFSLLQKLKISLEEYIEDLDQFDDITMLALRRKKEPKEQKHSLELPAKLANMPLFRDFVELASLELKLDAESIFAFKLAVDESVTNITQHGFQDALPGSIRITFSRSDEEAQLQIWDDGLAFDPESSVTPDVTSDVEDRPIGGLGIFFIKKMVDEITYLSDGDNGNTLTLSRRIK